MEPEADMSSEINANPKKSSSVRVEASSAPFVNAAFSGNMGPHVKSSQYANPLPSPFKKISVNSAQKFDAPESSNKSNLSLIPNIAYSDLRSKLEKGNNVDKAKVQSSDASDLFYSNKNLSSSSNFIAGRTSKGEYDPNNNRMLNEPSVDKNNISKNSEPIPKGFQTTNPSILSKSVSWKHSEPLKSAPIKSFLLKNDKKTKVLRYMLPYLDVINLRTNQNFIRASMFLEQLDESSKNEISELVCFQCNKFKMIIQLDCKHIECGNCIESKILKFIDKPSNSSFKDLSCGVCRQNYSDEVICKIIPSNSSVFLSYKHTDKLHTCERCGFELSLKEHFWTDLPCLHMCSSCLSDSIYMNYSKCFICQGKFQHLSTIKQRNSTCDACKINDNSIMLGYKCMPDGHTLCFTCLMSSAREKQCLACNKQYTDRKILARLKLYINKKCAKCNSYKALPDILTKSCCVLPVCTDCAPEDECPFCQAN